MGSGVGVDVLVVGAGQAGVELAASLRRLGATGRVVLVGREDHEPYQRPPLSKEFLRGEWGEERLALRASGFYADQRIELSVGERVESIALNDPGLGGVALTDRGRRLGFDRIAFATGGRPRRLVVEGGGLAGVHYLRDVADARSLRDDLAAAGSVVVVGGGFIGLEAAAAAEATGKRAVIVEAAERLLGRVVAPVVSEFYRTAHERRGASVLLDAGVSAFTGQGRVDGVVLTDGRRVAAEVVVVGVGMLPETDLAHRAGVVCEGGIVVDGEGRTNVPCVVAAGDCTVIDYDGRGPLRLESTQNAAAQARSAAASVLGVAQPRTEVPWFWSDQGDLKLQIAGVSLGFDETVLRGDPREERFSVLYYRDGQLIAINSINRPRDYIAVRRLLSEHRTAPAGAAADPAVPLKQFVTTAA